jgi:cell wall assembly regulator SMI1
MSLADSTLVWNRIDAVLQSKMSPAFASFLPGATWAELLDAERVLGQQLPDCVRAAYLRLNGQRPTDAGNHCFLMPFAEWVSLEAMVQDWQMLASLGAEFKETMTPEEQRESLRVDNCAIRKDPYHTGHIPIGNTYAGSRFYVDLAPGALGIYGQVFDSAPEDVDVRAPSCDSFENYMLSLVDHLEQGRLLYETGRGLVNASTKKAIVELVPRIWP